MPKARYKAEPNPYKLLLDDTNLYKPYKLPKPAQLLNTRLNKSKPIVENKKPTPKTEAHTNFGMTSRKLEV